MLFFNLLSAMGTDLSLDSAGCLSSANYFLSDNNICCSADNPRPCPPPEPPDEFWLVIPSSSHKLRTFPVSGRLADRPLAVNSKKMKLKDKTVLITGGASGIGKIMARIMLERKARVIIWDLNQEGIRQTKAELSDKGKIFTYHVDVSNLEHIQSAAEKVMSEIGVVDVLINNAGIVVGKYFHEHTASDISKTMEVNANAPMLITRAFLPDMLNQNSGHICNIASSGGLVSNPKMSVYVASKWSLIGWSDSLRLEMKQLDKNVHVTTIMPYYINTGMFAGVKSKIPILDPEATALTIVKAIEKNKRFITIPGYIYRLTRFAQAVLSINAFDWFAGRVLGIYKTMDDFTGRKQ